MKIVIAMDSFKGSVSSLEAGEAVKTGVLDACPEAQVVVCPAADGGEGTLDAMVQGLDGTYETVTVTGPLGEKRQGVYGILPGETAVIEMAQAAGLPLVPQPKRNPMKTTTYGVGELIAHAIKKGCRKFIVGIGGSSTNDGGVGMLQALGFEFLDEEGEQVEFGAQGLRKLSEIHVSHAMPQLKECTFRVACDVSNPLCGRNGCSAVFAPQKGASAEMVQEMDGILLQYANLTKKRMPGVDENYPGSGAAGGMGFAFKNYLGGNLQSGVGILLEETGVEQQIADADLVITGEGCLDGQSAMGKTPVGIAHLGKKQGKPVIALAGSVLPEAKTCHKEGITAYFSILPGACSLAEAMEPETTKRNLSQTASQVMRVFWKGKTQ